MRHIFMFIVMFSCVEDGLKNYNIHCFTMTISDSIPIQFWINGEQTFNEKAICGLAKQDCFCQPFECDDEIRIQVSDSDFALTLVIYDVNGTELTSIEFTEIEEGVYEVAFTPSDLSPAICEKVQFQIDQSEVFLNSAFDTNLDDWTNVVSASGAAWAWSATDGGSTSTALEWFVGAATKETYHLRHDFDMLTDIARTINYRYRATDALIAGLRQDGKLFCRYRKNGSTVATQEVLSTLTYGSFVNGSFLTSVTDFDQIEFYFTQQVSGGTAEGQIQFNISLFSINTTSIEGVAQSDCIDLKESHDCTTLIEYSNSSNFDGIVYETSPQPTFFLRIPAMFHEEDNPMTQEDLELSNGVIVTLRQSLQEKRLLETGYMPNYMHKKLQKVLMHEEITIDGTQWKRRDAYDADPIKKYNLKMAKVLLTKYNSVEKNTI